MKKTIYAFFILFLIIPISKAADKPGYEIKIRIQGMRDTMMYLANYYGGYTVKADSAIVDKKGWAVFKGAKPLPCGVYMTVLGSTKIFELAVNEQFFSLETDTGYNIKKMKIKGSPENEIFIGYQTNSAEYTSSIYKFQAQIREVEKDPAKKLQVALWRDSAKFYSEKETNLRKNIIKDYPNSMTAKIMKSLEDIIPPPAPLYKDGRPMDSNFQFNYYREHYFDNIDFTCDCLIRCPIYHNKLKYFFDKLVIMHPDSIVFWAFNVIEKTKSSKELFKYTVQYLTNTYASSNYVCMDAIPVNLILKYYTYKDAFWLDSLQIYRSRLEAEALFPTLCNKNAPNLMMHDSALEKLIMAVVKADTIPDSRSAKIYSLMQLHGTTNLYDVKAQYTILMFWDPDCSHCKAEMPKVKALYDKMKSKGVEVFAVCVESDYNKWIEYINANDLKWINVIDIYNISEFRKYYDIKSTPVILLLDKDKKILAKKLDGTTLDDYLSHELKLN
ncbi:MAG: thioredoxin-like domain-containing protein [Bacteroidota bacterium]|nr:thioredoxin-like domain-containing protein [Bacteroidota bacterium]